jgi:hypothetical protein
MLAAVTLLAISQLHASSSYSTSVTSASSLNITAATSGMTSSKFGVYLVDGSGVKRPTSEYSYGINASTYEVDITFSPAFTGTVKLKGLFAGADTTHDYDFKFTMADSGTLRVCDGCVDNGSGYAKRSYASKHFVSTMASSADIEGCANGLYYAYILDNQLWIATTSNIDSGCLTTPVNVKLAYSSGGYPTGSVHLGWIQKWQNFYYNGSDDRPF